jgi:hypothetical protein
MADINIKKRSSLAAPPWKLKDRVRPDPDDSAGGFAHVYPLPLGAGNKLSHIVDTIASANSGIQKIIKTRGRA